MVGGAGGDGGGDTITAIIMIVTETGYQIIEIPTRTITTTVVAWAASKRLETSKFKFEFTRARNLEIIGLVLGSVEAKFCK